MADFIFDKAPEYIGDGTIDMDDTGADVFKVAIYTDGSLPASSLTTKTALDASYTEVSNGNGYTTGGESLANITWSESSGVTAFDGDNVQWTSASFTGRWAVVYHVASDSLMCLKDFGQNETVSSGTFQLQWSASGIMTATAS